MFVEEKREGEVKPITPPLEPWQQTLLEVAQYLRVKGWTRGSYLDYQGRSCLIGALMAIEGQYAAETGHPIYKRLHAHLGQCPEHWNDLHARGSLHVIQMLETVALDPHARS